MAKKPLCALTHVRHEHFFLERWIRHYGAIVGRENLYVVIDGDDWSPRADLAGINVEVLLDAPRRRIKNDRWAASVMTARANILRQEYDYVIRGDVDEYVVIDPASGLDWPQALREVDADGYIFALGVDMVQHRSETTPVSGETPILGARAHGFVADKYTKPFVISRRAHWAGGAHRLLNKPVRMSAHFTLFHMALCDQAQAAQRDADRGGTSQHASFGNHLAYRNAAFDESSGLKPHDFATASALAHTHFPVEADGTQAKRPRAAKVPEASEKGIYTRVPERFFGLV